MFKQLMVLIFFAGAKQLHAQTISYAHVDSVTYDLMVKKDWKHLLKEGNVAKKNNIDFYYLDYRMGMANYYTNKFRLAQRNFEKAFSFYKHDDGLNESIYRSMLKNDYFDEAYRFSKHFTDTLSKKLKTNHLAFVNEVDAGGSLNHSDTSVIFSKYFFDVGVNAKIIKGISLYQHYNYMQLPTTGWTYRQGQYFIQFNIPLIKYFSVHPAFSFFKGKMDSFDVRLPGNVTLHNPELNSSGYLFSLNIKKSFSFFDLSEATSFEYIENVKRYELNPGIVFYPFFNNYFSIGGNYFALKDTSIQIHHGYDFFISLMPIKYVRFTTSYYSGNMKNGNSENGLLINNNNLSLLKNCLAVSVNIRLLKNIDIAFNYGRLNKFFHSTPPAPLPEEKISFTYTLIGSTLKFNF